MPIFFISYDLNHEDGPEHYTGLSEELGKLNGFRVMDRSVLVHVNTASARSLLEHLRPHLETGDRIYAVRVTRDNTFYLNAFPGTNDWLEQNLPPAEDAPEGGTPPTQ